MSKITNVIYRTRQTFTETSSIRLAFLTQSTIVTNGEYRADGDALCGEIAVFMTTVCNNVPVEPTKLVVESIKTAYNFDRFVSENTKTHVNLLPTNF